ncbi:MAG: acyl-CoA thioesterase [Planctomycetes bacterium]|jgi:acyl-CoA thioester hydrolase|nr:acyl-CoA thioesterase [Planctomycetota bacterium]
MPDHEHRVRVRYGETDQMGVVYHANYLAYMEEGRTRLMASRGASYAELERTGFGLAVRRASMRFRAPALYDEELLVKTRVDRVRGASINFVYAILRAADGTLLCEGETELACIDLKSPDRRPCMLPESIRRELEPREG